MLFRSHANAGIVEPEQLNTLAAAAKRDGITTTCVGFADGYDQQLLAGMADAGGGNDYWCAGPDQAGTVFRTEFAGLASLVAQNVSVELRPTAVVDDYAVLNEFPITNVPGGMQIALGDSYGGERRRVVAMLHVTPQQTEGMLDVAELVLRYASVGDTVGLHTVTIPVAVQIGGDIDSAVENPEVVEQVRLLRAATARREASTLADHGDLSGAAIMLEKSIELLELTSFDESEMSELRTDAERLRRHDWDLRSSKKHFAASREVQRSRASRFDKPVEPDSEL